MGMCEGDVMEVLVLVFGDRDAVSFYTVYLVLPYAVW